MSYQCIYLSVQTPAKHIDSKHPNCEHAGTGFILTLERRVQPYFTIPVMF